MARYFFVCVRQKTKKTACSSPVEIVAWNLFMCLWMCLNPKWAAAWVYYYLNRARENIHEYHMIAKAEEKAHVELVAGEI